MERDRQKPFSLELLWQSRLLALGEGKWQKALTQKERGQLKMLANVLGPLTNEVIGWAVANWWKFASKAQTEAGLPCFPGQPHIGFLLAHCAVAVNQMQASTKAQGLPAPNHQNSQAQSKGKAGTSGAAQTEEALIVPKAPQAKLYHENGKPIYNSMGEEIYYPSADDMAAIIKMFDHP